MQSLLCPSSDKVLFVYSVTCIRDADGHFTCLLKNNYKLGNISDVLKWTQFFCAYHRNDIPCPDYSCVPSNTTSKNNYLSVVFTTKCCSLFSDGLQVVNLLLPKRNHCLEFASSHIICKMSINRI